MSNKGALIILSGPSGVGKGTIRQALLARGYLPFWYSVSMTTRSIRPGETDGVEYYFVNDAEFDHNIETGNFLEYVEFVGHRYGTPKDKVLEHLNAGVNVILEIDVSGTEKILTSCADLDPITIFLIPPSFQVLEDRIRGRSTEDEATILRRLLKARVEMQVRDRYQHVVVNDNVEQAVEEIEKIIGKELSRRSS